MKTLKQTIPAHSKGVLVLPVAFILLISMIFANTASAQRPDRGGERNNTIRDHTSRQNNNVNRSADMRRTDRDVSRNQNTVRPQRDYTTRPRQDANPRQDVARQNTNTGQNGSRPQRDYTPKPRQDANAGNTSRNNNTADYNNANSNRRHNANQNRVNRDVTVNNTTINRTNNNYYNGRDRRIYSNRRPGYTPIYRHDYRPVYNAYSPSWRYSCLPGRYSYYRSLPATYLTLNFGGFGYRYWDGVFYRPYNDLFTVCAAPLGIFINVLPIGYRRIYVSNYPYYYYNGTYYDQRGDNYYVVSPPVGAVVESLPDGYDTVVIDGETYYTIDGAQYRPKVMDNGEIWYEVVKAN